MIQDLHRVIQLIEEDWRNTRVLVVGDLMLDRYIWGDVERISPEAPVPIVRAVRRNERPGGAANVAMNEPTLLRLIEALRPNAIVKGGDYREDTVVGTKEVESWGGRVKIVPTVEGCSTTRLIAKAISGADDSVAEAPIPRPQ
jgi:bifunctional ADP-heptose synthase (sugar kinase/adenylyltransferase)